VTKDVPRPRGRLVEHFVSDGDESVAHLLTGRRRDRTQRDQHAGVRVQWVTGDLVLGLTQNP
jgi:hypothetical protein